MADAGNLVSLPLVDSIVVLIVLENYSLPLLVNREQQDVTSEVDSPHPHKWEVHGFEGVGVLQNLVNLTADGFHLFPVSFREFPEEPVDLLPDF